MLESCATLLLRCLCEAILASILCSVIVSPRFPLSFAMSQGPFPPGTFPPGSYQAQVQRLYENLPQRLQEAYRRSAVGQSPMSSDDKAAYDHLAELFSQMEATNTWLEMTLEHRPGKKRDKDLEAWRETLAVQKQEWEDFAGEPVKVIGSVGGAA